MNEQEKKMTIIIAVVGLIAVVGFWYFTRPSPINVLPAEKTPKVIRVPASFGLPLSVGGGDYRMLILFEHGMVVTYQPSGEYVFEYVEGS